MFARVDVKRRRRGDGALKCVNGVMAPDCCFQREKPKYSAVNVSDCAYKIHGCFQNVTKQTIRFHFANQHKRQ